MQVYNSPYRNCFDCFKSVLQTEGFVAFYRSYTTQLTMNIPFQALHIMSYEFAQDNLNPERVYNPSTHMMSGAVAGGFAAAATTPLDVCKTLLNTQNCGYDPCCHPVNENGQRTISGMFKALKAVYTCHGFSGYFRGISARVIYVMPGTAISWSVYESFKYFLNNKNSDDGYFTPKVKGQVLAASPSTYESRMVKG